MGTVQTYQTRVCLVTFPAPFFDNLSIASENPSPVFRRGGADLRSGGRRAAGKTLGPPRPPVSLCFSSIRRRRFPQRRGVVVPPWECIRPVCKATVFATRGRLAIYGNRTPAKVTELFPTKKIKINVGRQNGGQCPSPLAPLPEGEGNYHRGSVSTPSPRRPTRRGTFLCIC